VKPGLDDVGRDAEDLGSFFRGEFLKIAEEDDGPISVGEFADGAMQRVGDFGAEQLIVRGRRVISDGLVEFLLVLGRENALASLHEAGVLGDAKDPGANVLRVAKVGERLEDAKEGFLRDLLGVLTMAAHKPAVLEDFGAKVVNEVVEGSRVAGEERVREVDLE